MEVADRDVLGPITRQEWLLRQAYKSTMSGRPDGLCEGSHPLMGYVLTEHCSMGHCIDSSGCPSGGMFPIRKDRPQGREPAEMSSRGVNSNREGIDID